MIRKRSMCEWQTFGLFPDFDLTQRVINITSMVCKDTLYQDPGLLARVFRLGWTKSTVFIIVKCGSDSTRVWSRRDACWSIFSAQTPFNCKFKVKMRFCSKKLVLPTAGRIVPKGKPLAAQLWWKTARVAEGDKKAKGANYEAERKVKREGWK